MKEKWRKSGGRRGKEGKEKEEEEREIERERSPTPQKRIYNVSDDLIYLEDLGRTFHSKQKSSYAAKAVSQPGIRVFDRVIDTHVPSRAPCSVREDTI